MNTEEKLKFLQNELDNRIESFAHKRNGDKSKAFRLKIYAVCFAGAITILLGVKVDGLATHLHLTVDGLATILKDVALVLGAIITVLNAIEAFYDHRSLWIRETATLVRLYSLKTDMNYAVAGLEGSEIDVASLNKFKDRYESILADDLNAWLKLRANAPLETAATVASETSS